MKQSRRSFIKITGAAGLGAALPGCSTAESQSERSKTIVHPLISSAPLIGRQDYLERMDRARVLMSRENLDGMLVTGGTTLNYFAGFNWGRSERILAMLLLADADPVFICPAFEAPKLAELLLDDYKIYTWQEDQSPFALMDTALKEAGHSSARVGIEESVRYFVSEGLRAVPAGHELLPAAAVIHGCRGRKSAKELDLMGRANKIAVLAWQGLRSRCENGMTEDDTRRIAREELARLGAAGYGFVLHGPNAAFPHGTKQRQALSDGMVVLVDGGFRLNGYAADITRTWVHGEPSKKQRQVWSLVKEAQNAALGQAKAGVTAGSVDEAARSVITAGGFGPDYKYFTHRLGHGIGMDGHEWPYLVRGSDIVLEPGMTFSNEPGVYIYDEFGIRLEDIMYISEEGPARLFTTPSESIDEPFAGIDYA